jgi:hypothetical protein
MIIIYQESAQRALDLSEISPSMVHESARRLAIELLDILCLAEKKDVRFAFPTQTLHIESLPEEKPTIPAQTATFKMDT